MAGLERKNVESPDRTQRQPKGPINIVQVGGWNVARAIFEPGWNFTECVKPFVGTPSCEQRHALYYVSGRMGIRMDDGQELEAGPGDVVTIEPGHDAWIVGDEPCVVIDFRKIGEE
jgi:mannose-6-phosphate isomerase-like protein (cupin superfamily)